VLLRPPREEGDGTGDAGPMGCKGQGALLVEPVPRRGLVARGIPVLARVPTADEGIDRGRASPAARLSLPTPCSHGRGVRSYGAWQPWRSAARGALDSGLQVVARPASPPYGQLSTALSLQRARGCHQRPVSL
jgi:hypothetical protein